MLRKFLSFLRQKNILEPVAAESDDDSADDAALANLHKQLLLSIKEPESLACSIVAQVPEDLIITTDGQIYSRQAIIAWINTHHNCPNTRNPLKESNLAPNTVLSKLAASYHNKYSSLEAAIQDMSVEDENDIRAQIGAFNNFVDEINAHAQAEVEKVRLQAQFKLIKNDLKLDINNFDHLAYWHRLAHKKSDICVSVQHPETQVIFKIPRAILELMVIASCHYSSVDSFILALDTKRHEVRQQPEITKKPFTRIAMFFRPPVSNVICEAHDLRQLKLN